MSQKDITTNNTKKPDASTVKQCPACFQHRLSQSNITTNLTIADREVENIAVYAATLRCNITTDMVIVDRGQKHIIADLQRNITTDVKTKRRGAPFTIEILYSNIMLGLNTKRAGCP